MIILQVIFERLFGRIIKAVELVANLILVFSISSFLLGFVNIQGVDVLQAGHNVFRGIGVFFFGIWLLYSINSRDEQQKLITNMSLAKQALDYAKSLADVRRKADQKAIAEAIKTNDPQTISDANKLADEHQKEDEQNILNGKAFLNAVLLAEANAISNNKYIEDAKKTGDPQAIKEAKKTAKDNTLSDRNLIKEAREGIFILSKTSRQKNIAAIILNISIFIIFSLLTIVVVKLDIPNVSEDKKSSEQSYGNLGLPLITISNELENAKEELAKISDKLENLNSLIDSFLKCSTDQTTPTPSPDQPDDITAPQGTVMIPGSDYEIGTDISSTASPKYSTHIDTFWIDQFEVTNGEYMKCVEENICAAPVQNNSFDRDEYFGEVDFWDYPVIYVTQFQAEIYCTDYFGGRLPTEQEWEVAARGDDGFAYPWNSNISHQSYANFFGNFNDTWEVGTFEKDLSDFVVYDMAGNVSEWTSSWYLPYPDSNLHLDGTHKVIRGGNFGLNFDDSLGRSYTRQHKDPNQYDVAVGFRCVWTPSSD